MAKKILAVSLLFLVLIVAVATNTFLRNSKPQEIVSPVIVEQKQIVSLSKSVIIGRSVEGHNITSYSYGNGITHLLFVGGIHGGYEWNSTLLAYTFIDYLKLHPEIIPKNITIDIIPSLNPDALYRVTGKEGRFTQDDVNPDKKLQASARFNANKVDLNRNFDCNWKPKSTWRRETVSAGAQPFSEPEAKTLRDFILKNKPSSVIFWHSQANGVYASQCKSGILPDTLTIMNLYARASGYATNKNFDAYEVTGAAEDWLASINIPAITVELKTHETIEFEENLSGVKALIKHYTR